MKFHIVINQTLKNLSETTLCLNARLFQLLEVETHILKKAGFGNASGSDKTLFFFKSCVLDQG